MIQQIKDTVGIVFLLAEVDALEVKASWTLFTADQVSYN